MTRFKGCFSLRVSTCLFIFTLCGRIIGALNEPVKVTVMEGNDVILPCSLSTKENIESKLFDWKKDGQKEVFLYNAGLHYNNGFSESQDRQFRGRVFHFQDELQRGVASIIIRNTKVADSGDYTCYFPRLQPSQTFHIELVVGEFFHETAKRVARSLIRLVLESKNGQADRLNIWQDLVSMSCNRIWSENICMKHVRY